MEEMKKKKWEYRFQDIDWAPFTGAEVRFLYSTLGYSMDLVSIITGIALAPLSHYIHDKQLAHDFRNEINKLPRGLIQAARARNWAALREDGTEPVYDMGGSDYDFFADFDMADLPEVSEDEAALVRMFANLTDEEH